MDGESGGPAAGDVELLSRIRAGSEPAFRELVNRHGRYLFGIARALVHDEHDAEDIVQETFAAVPGANYKGEAAVRTWLVGIVVRQAALLRRKRSRWKREIDVDGPSLRAATPAQAAVDARLDLTAMLERLSPEHREVIVLRELRGMSYDEIAGLLHVPRGTVESRLHRAREQLRQLFKA
jgi:RNA polymerase sigma-70 factor (ECF subfamily)